MAGAPKGNDNSSKSNRLWRNTINRAIKQDDADRLRNAAEKLLTLASEGEPWAIRELGDRLDGKAAQAIIGGGDDDPGIKIIGQIQLVRPKD